MAKRWSSWCGAAVAAARPGQSCFNHNIGSSCTLARWSVSVVGKHERENI